MYCPAWGLNQADGLFRRAHSQVTYPAHSLSSRQPFPHPTPPNALISNQMQEKQVSKSFSSHQNFLTLFFLASSIGMMQFPLNNPDLQSPESSGEGSISREVKSVGSLLKPWPAGFPSRVPAGSSPKPRHHRDQGRCSPHTLPGHCLCASFQSSKGMAGQEHGLQALPQASPHPGPLCPRQPLGVGGLLNELPQGC